MRCPRVEGFRAVALFLFSLVLLLMLPGRPAQAQQWIASIPAASNPYAIAVNSTTNKIYVGNQTTNSVRVIDGITFAYNDIPVLEQPQFIAVNEVTNKIYFTSSAENSLYIFDGATNQVTQLAVPLNGNPVIDTVRNKIYLAGTLGVAVVDGVTLSITNISLPPPLSLLSMALNVVTNKVYVTNSFDEAVYIVDGVTLSVTTIPLSRYSEDIVVDTDRNKIYTLSESAPVVLTAIDGTTLATASVMLNANSEGLAIDQLRGEIYVTGGGSLAAINGNDLSVTYIVLSGGATNFALGVEPRTNTIYVTSFDGQGNGVIAVNGRTHSVLRVETGGVPYGLAIDSVHDRIY